LRHLSGRLDEAFRKQGWRAIRKEAAAGGAQGSAPEDAPPLDAPSHALVERLQQTRSRATLGRRQSMPTGDGTPRPLGLPAGEDKLLPLAGARLLEAIDEPDCLRCR
jgi:hypothetical protein